MCKLCELKPVYEFTNQRKLCRRCFAKWFQKKVLYTIRKFSMINREDIIGYAKSNTFRNAVLEDVLKMFAEKTNVELVKLPSRKRFTKFAFPSTTDSKAYDFVSRLINSKIKINDLNELLPKGKIVIKPLYLFLDKEVLLYAKIKRLKFKRGKKVFSKIEKFIDESEKKHPEVKRAIVNSFLKLYI